MYQAVIIDDEKIIVDGLKEAIHWDGYQFEIAFTATNPLLALEYIRNNSQSVHLVITDISMPELSGTQLIALIKEINPLISIIVLSAYDNFDYVKTALRNGAENYLLKPVDENELQDTVGQIVRHIEKRKEIAAQYGPNTFSFRSSFTERWVHGTIAPNEIYSKAEILGINLDANQHTVIICSMRDENKKQMAQLFDLFLAEIIGKFFGNFYFENPNRMVCVLSSLEGERTPLEPFLLDFSEKWQRQGLHAFLTYGPSVNHYTEVNKSYQKAQVMHALKFAGFQTIGHYQIQQSILSVLQQPYRSLVLSDYVKSLSKVFPQNLPSAMAKKYAITTIAWGLSQLDEEKTKAMDADNNLALWLELFPDDDSSTGEYLVYSAEFASLCYDELQLAIQSLFPCVDAVLDVIHEFSSEDVSLKNLAQQLNISPSYLGSIFKQQTGDYFNDYLTKARLEYATELILTTDLIIKEIVDKVGFSSQTYFNRIFKNHYDVTPIEYRRKHRIISINSSSTMG